MTEVRPLRSTGITPLRRYYGPLRLPAAAVRRVMHFPPTLQASGGFEMRRLRASAHALFCRTRLLGATAHTRILFPERLRHAGPPRFLDDLSERALPRHPGWFDGCSCSLLLRRWQTSPPKAGWSPPMSLTRPNRDSLALGSLLRRPETLIPFAPRRCRRRTGPPSLLGCPCRKVRSFVSYEQLSRLTPFSQIDRARLGLAHLRNAGRQERKKEMHRDLTPDDARSGDRAYKNASRIRTKSNPRAAM